MSRPNQILKTLQEKGEVSFKPHGNSMVPKIYSGDLVRVKAVPSSVYRIGDIVYCKVSGSYYLHLLTAIDYPKLRFQISNNKGYVNGWISAQCMYGICIEVEGKVILSEEEIKQRIG
jgi:phage repressor protein C with HTH and peptisase S24 domain